MNSKDMKRILATTLVGGTMALAGSALADATPKSWLVAQNDKKHSKKMECAKDDEKCQKAHEEGQCGQGQCGKDKMKGKAAMKGHMDADKAGKEGEEMSCGEGSCG